MEWLTDPSSWMALATLVVLETILGIDNIIFISILVSRLPAHQRERARMLGLGLAMGTRILLLLSLAWVMSLTTTLFSVFTEDISGRDLILLGGGLFLLAKSVFEIHNSLEGHLEQGGSVKHAGFYSILAQIAVIDIVFSLDSVITAVGLAEHVEIMIAAVVISVGIMMIAAGPIGRFVDEHPTMKILAMTFLTLIGVTLIAEGLDMHIPKGYIYFAMAFSFGVEMLNMRIRRRIGAPVALHKKAEELE